MSTNSDRFVSDGDDATVLWNRPVAPLHLSRAILFDFEGADTHVRTGISASGDTLHRELLKIRRLLSGEQEVVVVDDATSSGCLTLHEISSALKCLGVRVRAFAVGHCGGTKCAEDGELLSIEGAPVIAPIYRYASAKEADIALSANWPRPPQEELLDLGYFPESGDALLAGYLRIRSGFGRSLRIFGCL